MVCLPIGNRRYYYNARFRRARQARDRGRNTMKRSLMLAAVVAFAPLAASAETTFRLAYVAPPPVWGPIAERFAQHVADKMKGEIKILSLGGGQLGNLPQNYAGLKT